MSDDDPHSEGYSSEAGDFGDEDNEVDLEDDSAEGLEADQDQEQENEHGLEPEGRESSDSDEADSEEEDDEDDDDDDDEDGEGDLDDDDNQDFELEAGLVAMEESDGSPEEAKLPQEGTPPPAVRPLTPAQIRRGLFTTGPPYPRSWTIEPICAIPHPVATHALAASLCLSYLVTGSEDGFLRSYDLYASVNGKTYLTAPQRHHCGVGEGLMKAGILKSWWENSIPASQANNGTEGEGKELSSVHSLVVQGDALWGMSGSASGHLNLFTVRHDAGRIHHTFNAHKGPVSGLALSSDELSAFSAGWDGHARQWDLNTGQVARTYESHGAQVVGLQLRPMTPATVTSDGKANGARPGEYQDKDDTGSSNASDDDSLFGDDSDEEGAKPKPKRTGRAGPGSVARSSSNISADVMMVAYIDGQVKLWDRRTSSVIRSLELSERCPPWCVSACWSVNGNEMFAGRRNGAIDMWDFRQHSSQGGVKLVKALRNPASSGSVSCVAAFPDGQHIVCASQDNIRLWKVSDETHGDHKRGMPFKIIAGHHGGTVSQIRWAVDIACRNLPPKPCPPRNDFSAYSRQNCCFRVASVTTTMATFLSPGVAFILKHVIPRLVAPPLALITIREIFAILGLQRLVPRLVQSTSGVVLVSLASSIIYVILNEKWKAISKSRAARKLGAIEFPKAKGSLPGNLDILLRMIKSWETDYPAQLMYEYTDQHGASVNMMFLWEDQIWTTSPSLIKTVLATDFGNFVKGEKFQHAMDSVLGSGVFNSDGEMWKFHRSMTRPFFTRDRITDFDIFERHANEVILQMKECFTKGMPLDFQDILSRFTIDSATEFLFGKSIHSLASPLTLPGQTEPITSINTFSHSFAAVQSVISFRARVGSIWPITEIFGDKTKDHMKVINAFIDPILNDALERERKRKEEIMEMEKDGRGISQDAMPDHIAHPEGAQTLLGHLISMTDDKKILRDQLVNILIAGRDTTAAGLTFITYFLAQDPVVLRKLRKEVLEVVGRDARPTFDQLKHMRYMKAVIHESLRLLPPVPFNVKSSINSATWIDPSTGIKYYIPPNTKFPWSVITMQRSVEYWGPDAEQFDPDRWLDDRNKKYFLANPSIYVPFHAGPRICLGQKFALNEMSFFLVRLMQNFDQIELAPDAQPPESRPPASWKGGRGRKSYEEIWPGVHLTSYSKGGMWVRMRVTDSSGVLEC